MPAHGRYGATRGVRWDAGLGEFVLKCDDCAVKDHQSYWPLTLEFWDPRTMQRCRACDRERRRRMERERLANDPAYRAKRRADAMVYHRANKDLRRVKHTLYMRDRRAIEKKKGEAA